MKNKLFVFVFLIGFAFILGFRKKLFSGPSSPQRDQPQAAAVEPKEEKATESPTNYMSPMLGAIQPKANAPRPKTQLPTPTAPNDNPYATMSPYLSPFYTPPENAGKRSGDEPKYQRNLYFETLAKQMEEMQKQQEDEKNGIAPPEEPEVPPQINEPPEEGSQADALDEQETTTDETQTNNVEENF